MSTESKHTSKHNNWDVGGYCNALVTNENGDGVTCGYRKPSATPELDKLRAVMDESDIIGEFLVTCGYVLAENVPREGGLDDVLVPVPRTTNEILAKYYGIDLFKVEEEKRAILDSLKAASREEALGG